MKFPSPKVLLRVGIAFGLCLALLIGLLAGGWFFVTERFNAYGPSPQKVLVVLEKGDGVSSIATKLENTGLIKSKLIFKLGVQLERAQAQLKAGEYLIPAEASMREIVEIFREGRVVQYPITVAEGLTSQEVVALLQKQDVLTGEVDEIPAEGSLLPNTYYVIRNTTRMQVIERMRRAQETLLAKLWPKRAPDLPFATPEEALILASIVEKETGIASERPRVAAVFVNRLRVSMRLQSDPTIIYGITNGSGPLGRPIRRSEIAAATPYNTYQIDGLPPTPIANPGKAAIEAVLNPPKTKELYFVADGSGGHAFSSSGSEHNRNVARWRALQRRTR